MRNPAYIVKRLDELIIKGNHVLATYNQPGNIDAHDLWITEIQSFLNINAPKYLDDLFAVSPRIKKRYGGDFHGRAVYELLQEQLEVIKLVRGEFALLKRGMPSIRNKRAKIASITANDLRIVIGKLKNEDTIAFLNEAVECLEAGLYRAGIVLSWVGAISVLHKFVIDNYLFAFNSAGKQSNANWRNVKSTDDLYRIKEHDFIEMLNNISVIKKTEKEQLLYCLKTRNACGHPSSYRPNAVTTGAHIQLLIDYVFYRFAI